MKPYSRSKTEPIERFYVMTVIYPSALEATRLYHVLAQILKSPEGPQLNSQCNELRKATKFVPRMVRKVSTYALSVFYIVRLIVGDIEEAPPPAVPANFDQAWNGFQWTTLKDSQQGHVEQADKSIDACQSGI